MMPNREQADLRGRKIFFISFLPYICITWSTTKDTDFFTLASFLQGSRDPVVEQNNTNEIQR
jgi:hypothetical protein